MSLSPRTQALAYRIWAYCEPLGWDASVRDIAEALGEPISAISGTVGIKGWHTRLRAPEQSGELGYRAHSPHMARIARGVVPDVVSGRIGVLMETFQ